MGAFDLLFKASKMEGKSGDEIRQAFGTPTNQVEAGIDSLWRYEDAFTWANFEMKNYEYPGKEPKWECHKASSGFSGAFYGIAMAAVLVVVGIGFIISRNASSPNYVKCTSCDKLVTSLKTDTDAAGESRTWCNDCWNDYNEIMGR